MYPRNAASPEPIAIGAVVQISDGAVQTSGCTVRIKPIGVAEGDGAGTTAYSTDGIVLYTPTQAETNYTSFILIAKKASCLPACVTVVTTASSVPGRTMPADGSVTAAVIADNAIDTATFAAGTTLPRVTLVDTTTTNTDMRGTDNAALAATALSTAVWTSTIAGRIDVAISSRLAPLVAGRDIAVAATTGAVVLDSASVTAVQDGLATEANVTAVGTAVTGVLARIGSFTGTGVNNILGFLRAMFRSDASTPSDMGGTATAADHSLQAVRVRGDAAWTTETGGASLEDIISGVQSVSGAIVEAQNSATLSIRIGDTWTQDIDSLGDLTGKVVTFAMKKRASDADTAAIVFITEGTGLTRLNGTATTAGWGSITINDEVAGDITLRLESDATSILTSGSYVDAVKLLKDGDDRSPRNAGRTVVSAGVIADIT